MIFEVVLIIIILIILIFLKLGVDLEGNFEKKGADLRFEYKILIFSRLKVYSDEFPNEKRDKEDKDRKIDFKVIEPCIKPFLNFLESLFKSLGVRKLEGHLDLGLSSYVSTARCVGYMWAFLVFPNSYLDNTNLTVAPHFDETIIDFEGHVDVNINLLKLVIPIIRLILDRNVLKLIKEGM